MVRSIVKAAIVALGIMAAAPLSAQQPDAPSARREWVARQPGRRFAGPRHRRRMRRRHRRMGFRRFQRMRMMGRMQAPRWR